MPETESIVINTGQLLALITGYGDLLWRSRTGSISKSWNWKQTKLGLLWLKKISIICSIQK